MALLGLPLYLVASRGLAYNTLGSKPRESEVQLESIELCAGAGGQALGLEMAGFSHRALIDIDKDACATLRLNRPAWKVVEADLWDAVEGKVEEFQPKSFQGVDLVAGGVPCPPFSKAGKQLGDQDERDLFPAALRLVAICQPRAIMLENVRGILDPVFDEYRRQLDDRLRELEYDPQWRLLNASHFGVPQLRPRVVLVAMRRRYASNFRWPDHRFTRTAPTVGEALYRQMASRGWKGAEKWKVRANTIAPTLVGGSKKHGGPDLGPTRAKRAWAALGVDGHGIADDPPGPNFVGTPRLTVEMAAALQGFPPGWQLVGRKTSAYRQVGNAFPPPVAEAVGSCIFEALTAATAVRAA